MESLVIYGLGLRNSSCVMSEIIVIVADRRIFGVASLAQNCGFFRGFKGKLVLPSEKNVDSCDYCCCRKYRISSCLLDVSWLLKCKNVGTPFPFVYRLSIMILL